MRFLQEHNPNLARKFHSIADLYKAHGEHWQIRWDYAFFQMVVETNFLAFKRANGEPGDVSIHQNNFAGLGATGGGVPGDRYPDVSTGVLAQIHHLVVYSGERVQSPAGHRTRLKQDDILRASAPVVARRPVTFQDLAGRWAADRAYGRTITAIAARFQARHCQNGEPDRTVRPANRPHRSAHEDPTSPPATVRAAIVRAAKTSPETARISQASVPRPVLLRKPAVARADAIVPAEPPTAKGQPVLTPRLDDAAISPSDANRLSAITELPTADGLAGHALASAPHLPDTIVQDGRAVAAPQSAAVSRWAAPALADAPIAPQILPAP